MDWDWLTFVLGWFSGCFSGWMMLVIIAVIRTIRNHTSTNSTEAINEQITTVTRGNDGHANKIEHS